MIDLQVLEAVSPFVEHTANRAITVTPGSTLSNLTRTLIDKSTFIVSARDNADCKDDFTITDVVNVVNEASKDDVMHVAAHQSITDEAVKNIARIMRNNILLTRSVVLPIVDQYTERLATVVSENINRGALALNILEDKRRTILSSPQLKDIISDQVNRTQYDNITLPRYHKADLTIPELTAIIKTGNTSFDKVITDWLSINQLDEMLKVVYREIFLHSNHVCKEFQKYLPTNNYHKSIIALLMCWGLVKNIQEDISIGFKEYKEAMEVLSAGCSGVISQAITSLERGLKYKNLVIQYPSVGREFRYDSIQQNAIIVDPTLYREYLETGGSPEAIFGAYLTDRAVDLTSIVNNNAKYLKEYTRQVNRGKLTAINDTLTIVKNEMTNITFDIVKDILAEQDEDVDNVRAQVTIDFTGTKHVENAREFIRHIGSHDITNYYTLMMNFVCDCFFEGTNVGTLIRKIDSLDPNGEGDINEIAIIATTDIVVDWFLSQIEANSKEISMEGYYVK